MKISSYLKTILTSFSLFCLPLAVTQADQPKAADCQQQDCAAHCQSLLEDYLPISNALFQDDLDGAKKAAAVLAEKAKGCQLAELALKVANAQDLASAREAFKTLSALALEVSKEKKTGHMAMHCPMVKGGGGHWLSADEKVNNPYFGAAMPHCGRASSK